MMKSKLLLSIITLLAVMVPKGVWAQIIFDFDAVGKSSDALAFETVESANNNYGRAYNDMADNITTCSKLGDLFWIKSSSHLNMRNIKCLLSSNSNVGLDANGIKLNGTGTYFFVLDGLNTGDIVTVYTKTSSEGNGYMATYRNMTGYKYSNTKQASGTVVGAEFTQGGVAIGYKGNITANTPLTITGGGSYIVMEFNTQYQRIHKIEIIPAGTTYEDKVETFPFKDSWYSSGGNLVTGTSYSMEGVYNYNSSPAADSQNKIIYPILTYNENDCTGHFAITRANSYYHKNGIRTGKSYFIFTNLHAGDQIKLTTGGVTSGTASYKYANLTTSSTAATLAYTEHEAATMVVGEASGEIPTATEVTITVTTAGNGYVVLQGTGDDSYVSKAIITTKDGTVTYPSTALNESVTLSAKGISTFSSNAHLDFTNVENLTAYVVNAVGETVTLEPVNGVVPAGTGLILKGSNNGDYSIPFVTIVPVAPETNYLVPALVQTTVEKAVEGTTNYVLTIQNDNVVFAPIGVTSATVGAGKAYLSYISGGNARSLALDFGGETTGIDTSLVNNEKENSVYDLQGRRVAQPKQGLYIVNGKKVVIK